jgi:hypothetical protein
MVTVMFGTGVHLDPARAISSIPLFHLRCASLSDLVHKSVSVINKKTLEIGVDPKSKQTNRTKNVTNEKFSFFIRWYCIFALQL